MVGIAITRMPGNNGDLAIHRGRQMRASAVIADEKMAALEHGAHLAERRATDDERLAAQQLRKFASFFPFAL